MKNQVQLIAYVDRIADNIRDFHSLLSTGPLRGLFGGVHVLPFFHPIDGADAGFDPIDHSMVDARLGSWEDVESLAKDLELVVDLIVNHISSQSYQFHDFSRKGADSEYAGLFLTYEAVFPDEASERDLATIHRQRAELPFTTIRLDTGETRRFWTTFTPQQIDIDVASAQGNAYLENILQTFARHGVRMVRLDAVGFAIKRAGTSCFMLPETFAFIEAFTRRAHALDIEVLVETHAYYRKQIEIARSVDRVYDFALPPLLLHAFAFGTARPLQRWIEVRPTNALTVLDTHDGIGIFDIGSDPDDPNGAPGLVDDAELRRLVEIIHERTGDASRQASGSASANVDEQQINCTYFDALGRDDAVYLMCRAIQFFLPGIPQVYYVGLLAGENDLGLLRQTRVGRDINRRRYSRADLERHLKRPVVAALLDLVRLRNSHAAFGGDFSHSAIDDRSVHLRWTCGREFAELSVDFANATGSLRFSSGGAMRTIEYDSRLAGRESTGPGRSVQSIY